MMTEPKQQAEDLKRKLEGDIERITALVRHYQLYGLVPENCDPVATAKLTKAFRRACKALKAIDVTLSTILAEQKRQELEKSG